MKIMRKKMAMLLCLVMIFGTMTGCGQPGGAKDPSSDRKSGSSSQESASTLSKTEAEDSGNTQTESMGERTGNVKNSNTDEGNAEPDQSVFKFQPKVSSVYLEEIFGETMIQVWNNIVDAVLAGEDVVECPDQDTFEWVIYQFPDRCFPVLDGLIEPDRDRPVENGIAHIRYNISKKKLKKKVSEFESLVEEILNKTMKEEDWTRNG